ncbi:MAG: hypothetical protein CMN30_05310 [Sandaracinus sp.]|uniref:acyltransferase n=1 Tax=Nocardioides sp. TaxID=35761 RepID=UPI000C38DF98|nr:hypothetical protein [Sandaracinus sp.]
MNLRTSTSRRRNRRHALRANVHTGSDFRVGVNSVIWAPTMLLIGNNVICGSYNRIEVDGEIGDHVLMANNVSIIGRRDHAIDQIGVPITQANRVHENPDLSDPVRIGADVWLGFGVTILSGVTIGSSTIIGAGSLVTHDVPANTIAIGTPARKLRDRFDETSWTQHWNTLASKGIHVPERASLHT